MLERIEQRVIFSLQPVEEEAIETVLKVLERMTYLGAENDTNVLYWNFDEFDNERKVEIEAAYRAIQALEEITGVWD